LSRGWRRAAVLASLLAAGSALAFVRATTKEGSICLWWRPRQLSYLVNDFSAPAPASPATGVCAQPAQVYAAVDASFATWTQAGSAAGAPCTDLKLVGAGRTGSIQTGNDGQNLVVWRHGPCSVVAAGDGCLGSHTCADKFNCWEHEDLGSQIIALTTTSYRVSTGEILDADMELNAWEPTAGSGYYFTCVNPPASTCTSSGQAGCIRTDVENTVTHEAGHFLGLAHATMLDATMYAGAVAGETSKRTLAQDDVDGICSIYPAGKPTANCIDGPCPAPCTAPASSGGGGCGCRTAGGEGLLAILALLPAFRRRRSSLRRAC
jgi:hypothetical protein